MNDKLKDMKKGAILYKVTSCSVAALCFLLMNLPVISARTVPANDTIPYGLWEASQITVEKSTNGKIEKHVYEAAADVQGFIPCLQSLEITDSATIVLRYPDSGDEITGYTLEDGQLIISTAGAILKYRYSADNETLTLNITHKYVWNQPGGLMDDIEESWAIILNKQK